VELPAVVDRDEAELLAVPSGDCGTVLSEERHLDGRQRVEPARQRALVLLPPQPVALAGAVRRRDEHAVEPGEGLLEARDTLDPRLAVVGADDERIPLEEGVEPAGRPADGARG